MSEAVLDVGGVHAHYGQSHILHGVTFRLARGECMSLMGRNGMGKSTTLRAIMGLVKPTLGKVWVLGTDMAHLPTDRIATLGVAYVPENRGIFPNLTVLENLVMAARPPVDGGGAGWTLERVFDLFPRLNARKDSWGNNLSGGEQQMLTIGRALMTNPRILLLDEATEGLAPLVRDEIWRVIGVIKDSGIASIIVDKNVKRLAGIADRHVVLVKGRVVFNGNGEALMGDPEFLNRHLGV
ncbi:MAG: ABC transporter ATP-binding protein [Rhodospirillales bacterium]|nr:ABC transporter ATP-binding protein [Rhodospirillales bacterium]